MNPNPLRSMDGINRELAKGARKIEGCRSCHILLPSTPSPSYGWNDYRLYLIVQDKVFTELSSLSHFLDSAFSLHRRMMERWYPLYWHPFTWIPESGMDYLGPLERSEIMMAETLLGDKPEPVSRLEPPILYYASKLRNNICQARRWLYAYGPEGMYPANWGKFILWTRTACSLATSILDPQGTLPENTTSVLEPSIGPDAEALSDVLKIKEDDLATRDARRTQFRTLSLSVDAQRSLMDKAASCLEMSDQIEIKVPKVSLSAGQRAGHRAELAKTEDELLSGIQHRFGDSVHAQYVCEGEPSSIVVLDLDVSSERMVDDIRSIFPGQADLFLWVVFEEEVPFFTKEAPAEFQPTSYGPVQARQLIHGRDLLNHARIPASRSALSCLNAFMPMVRTYSFFTRHAHGECEPEGLDNWINQYYTTAKMLLRLSEVESAQGNQSNIAAYRDRGLPRPRDVQEGLFELETELSGINEETVG